MRSEEQFQAYVIKYSQHKHRRPCMYIHGCRPQWSYKDLRHTTFSSSGHCTGNEILGQKIQALESCVRSQAGRTIRPLLG